MAKKTMKQIENELERAVLKAASDFKDREKIRGEDLMGLSRLTTALLKLKDVNAKKKKEGSKGDPGKENEDGTPGYAESLFEDEENEDNE